MSALAIVFAIVTITFELSSQHGDRRNDADWAKSAGRMAWQCAALAVALGCVAFLQSVVQ